MAAFDFRELVNARNAEAAQGGGGSFGYNAAPQGGYMPQGNAPMNWRNFSSYYNQLANANQIMQNQDRRNAWSTSSRGDDGGYQPRYRQMTDLEKFSAGARQASDWLGTVVGDTAFQLVHGRPITDREREERMDIKPENIPYQLANLPSMLLTAIPDTAAWGAELISGTPAQEGNLETGMIEDRKLTSEETMADLGYLGLTALSYIPVVGWGAKLAGGGAKAIGRTIARGAASSGNKVANALENIGNIGLHGSKEGVGLAESIGSAIGKKGAQLNAYRWGDVALDTALTGLGEGTQEAGQTLMEDIRYHQVDENTPDRMLQGGVWGAFGGGIMGGAARVPGTIMTNSRANRGLDRYGNKIDPNATVQEGRGENFYQFYDPNVNREGFGVTREFQQHLQDQEGDQKSLSRLGSSIKAVVGRFGQNMNTTKLPVRALVRNYQRDADDIEKVKALAEVFDMQDDLDRFNEIMHKSDEEIVAELSPILEKKMEGKPKDRAVFSTARWPYTKGASNKTIFIDGLTLGNTIAFAPGVPSTFGGDIDGDLWSLYMDKDRTSWEFLPSRWLMGRKTLPAKNKNKDANQADYIPYGTVEFDFEKAGITKLIRNNSEIRRSMRDVLTNHGITNISRQQEIIDSIINKPFDAANDEQGIKWEHVLADSLSKLVEEENGYEVRDGVTIALAGDDLVSDIMQVVSYEAGVLADISHAIESGNLDNPDLHPTIEATVENIPVSRGDMGPNVNLMQVASFFGKLNYELTKKESPMFRFKQMTAWNAKFVKMVEDGLSMLGMNNIDDITAKVKWCMQMINNLHLPIDYIESLFKAVVLQETMVRLGINESTMTKRFGTGLNLDEFQTVFTQIWNANAEKFTDAVNSVYTDKSAQEEFSFNKEKSTIKEEEPLSFVRAFSEIFGGWDLDQLVDDPDNPLVQQYTFEGAVEAVRENPMNFNLNMFEHIPGGFNELFKLALDDYEGKQNAQMAGVISNLEKCKELNAEFTEDKDGYITWREEDEVEVNFWFAAIQNLVGMATARLMGLGGPKWAATTGWGKYIYTKDPEKLKRGLVALRIMSNFEPLLRVAADPKMNDEIHLRAAMSEIDFNNPLNRWILYRMRAQGIKDGVTLSLKPLFEITNPEEGTYQEFADAFDNNEAIPVRKHSDMLLYYALQDKTSSLSGSDMSTRVQTMRDYVKAATGNSFGKARQFAQELFNLETYYDGADLAAALSIAFSEFSNKIDTRTYAVACHDAGFASGKASEKAKSGDAASLHNNSVTDWLGGYSASFIQQLGVSVGSIDVETAYNIESALKEAFLNPNESFDVQIGMDARYLPISRESIFKAVGEDVKPGDTPTWNQYRKLFQEAPQLLCELMPYTYEPLSPTANTVAKVMIDKPVNIVESIVKNSKDTGYLKSLQIQKVQNHLLADQDSTVLIFGTIDHNYDSLVSNTAAWTQAFDSAVGDWSKFIYDVATIDDDVERRNVIDEAFSGVRADITQRTKSSLRDLESQFNNKRDHASRRSMAKRTEDLARRSSVLSLVERWDTEHDVAEAIDKKDAKDKEFNRSEALKRSYKEETKVRARRIKDAQELLVQYHELWLGVKLGVNSGSISMSLEESVKNHFRTAKDKNGENICKTEEDVNRAYEQVRKESGLSETKPRSSKLLITRKEVVIDGKSAKENCTAFITKVKTYYTNRKYKRTQSEYLSNPDAFNNDIKEWEENVKRAYNWEDHGEGKDQWGWTKQERMNWIEEQAEFWNKEIISTTMRQAYDTYGDTSASNELARLDEAKSFVVSMVDEIRSDQSIHRYTGVDTDSIVAPTLSFQNKATSNHIEAASIELESGGAVLMSGANAGSYQWLGILDFFSENFECPAESRTGLTRDQVLELMSHQGNKLNYLKDDGSIGTVSENAIRYRYSDEQIAAMEFYPQEDCLFGAACHKHNPLPTFDAGGSYVGGRYTFAELGWYISEKKVFKSKKKRRVFAKIAHIVRSANDLKKFQFSPTENREAWLTEMYAYQEALARHINQVFLDEQMDDEFGLDDARIFAQFMSPCFEITYTDKDGVVRKETMSKWCLASEAEYENQKTLIQGRALAMGVSSPFDSGSSITSVRPVAMSLFAVCKKLTHDLNVMLEADEGWMKHNKKPSQAMLNDYLKEACYNWVGKAADEKEMSKYLKSMPVMKLAGNRPIQFGSSPNSMQFFLESIGMQRISGSYSEESLINHATSYSESDRKTVQQVNKSISKKTEGLEHLGKIVIVKTLARELGKKTPLKRIQNIDQWNELERIADDFSVPNAKNAVLIPEFTDQDNTSVISEAWHEAKRRNRVLLVPANNLETFKRAVARDNVPVSMLEYALEDGSVLINGQSYMVMNPWRGYSNIETDGMKTYIREFDPHDVSAGIADFGRLFTDDSGSLVSQRFANKKMFIEDTLRFSDSLLLGNATVPGLKGMSFDLVDLDSPVSEFNQTTVRERLLREIDRRLEEVRTRNLSKMSKEEKKAAEQVARVVDPDTSNRIILPKYEDTYDLSDTTTLESIRKYLQRKDRELQPDGTVNGTVRTTDCINIVSVTKENGETYFLPLIFNSGAPVELDRVWLDTEKLRTHQVEVRFDAHISYKEGEAIKNIFPSVAYKTYTRIATEEEETRMPKLGFDLTIVNPYTQDNDLFQVDMVYSGFTEEGRLTDSRYQVKLENLANLLKLLPHNYFQDHFMSKDANGTWTVDPKKVPPNVDPEIIKQMTDWGNIGVWYSFVYDKTIMIHQNPKKNEILRMVAQSCLDHGMNPMIVFSNMYYDKIRYIDYNHFLIFGRLGDDELEQFFYTMNERLSYDGINEPFEASSGRQLKTHKNRKFQPMINQNGQILCHDGKYRNGHIQFLHPTDDSTMLGVPSGNAKFGLQGILNAGLVSGLRSGKPGNSDFATLLDYARVKNGDPRDYIYGGKKSDTFWRGLSNEEAIRRASDRFNYQDYVDEKYLRRNYRAPSATRARRRKISDQFRHIFAKNIAFVGRDGKGMADLTTEGSAEKTEYEAALNKFKSTFREGMRYELTELEVQNIFRQTTGTTHNENGDGAITVKNFVDWVDRVCEAVEAGRFPFESGNSVFGRPLIPMVDSNLLNRLLTSDKFRQRRGGNEWTRESMIAMMREEREKTLTSLAFTSMSQRESLYTMMDYIGGTYGDPELSRPIGEYGMHLMELIESKDPWYDSISRSKDMSNINERRAQTERMIKQQQDIENRRNYVKVPANSAEAGFFALKKPRSKGTVFNTLSAVSRIMATLNPALPFSAILSRFITQGTNKFYMAVEKNLTHGVIGGNPDGLVIKTESGEAAKHALAQSPLAQELWLAFNTMNLSGEDVAMLMKVNSAQELANKLEERRSQQNWFEKMQAKAFRFSAGGRHGTSWQIENFVDRIFMMLDEENAPQLAEVVDNKTGMTALEQMLVENPETFLIDLLTTKDNNPYFMEAHRARNWVQQREHAGQSMFGMAMSQVFERQPFGKFMIVSGLCRFPHYAYETGGWFLNHFAPVSTVAYLLRQAAIDLQNDPTGHPKMSKWIDEHIGVGVERTQWAMSLKEAMFNDAMMIGGTAFAAMLASLAGAIEPPDDDDYDEYAGNPCNWTICGFRVMENWWLMDILGPFGAMALTWKTIQIGKPRFDIMQNWMAQALQSNPLVKITDVANTLIDPTEQYLDQYENVVEQYGNVEGGVPQGANLFFADSITYGLIYGSQFITPSFLREWSTSAEGQGGYERSYKKVLNDKGEEVYTDYLDARIRKATRSNLALGLLMDIYNSTIGPHKNTGYMAQEMVRTRIPDRNQLDAYHYYSLYDEEGKELPEAQKQALAFEVITILNSYSDMDALYKEGFVLPMETRIYVSQMLNDWKKYEQDEYSNYILATNGGDYYLIGEGDFTLGRMRFEEIKKAYRQDLDDIQGLFDKLWSEEMNRGLQMYYRLPTTYARTTSGEWYATGVARSASPLQWISPAVFGLGDKHNIAGTMGREGNWETPSAVNPEVSAGGRNLVPIDPEYIKHPKLEDFGDDKNNGYSDTEAGKQYSLNATVNRTNTTTSGGYPSSSGYPSSGYPRSSGGSGYRYGGGGGGGGGYSRSYSSRPNIYAPTVDLPNANTSRIMNTDRNYGPNYDYLRPDFETKGSREAYRRSDF